jgi:hypothetical protein
MRSLPAVVLIRVAVDRFPRGPFLDVKQCNCMTRRSSPFYRTTRTIWILTTSSARRRTK